MNYSNMVNVLMPMLGKGSRMFNIQSNCKPLMSLPDGNLFFLKALSSLENYNIDTVCLVVLEEYFDDFCKLLEEVKSVSNANFVKIIPHSPTDSPFSSVCVGMNENPFNNSDIPCFILDCDIYCKIPFVSMDNIDGNLFYFIDRNPNKCFINTIKDGDLEIVKDIREKKAISDKSIFGAYLFHDSNLIVSILSELKKRKEKSSNVSDLFHYLLEINKSVSAVKVENVLNFGTKEEYEELVKNYKNNIVDKQYKCLMFDFDGTLFDTFKLNFEAYKQAYSDLGVDITEEMFKKTNGLNVYQFNDVMNVECDVEKLRSLKSKYYRELSVHARPNRYLLDIIKRSKIPCVLVTTARKINIELLLEKYDLFKYFKFIITQDDVSKHKPAPDSYLFAQRLSGVKASECLAFEDSIYGVIAARSSRVDCVQINRFFDDCIKDMSGGSDATTKLYYNIDSNSLYVRKEAFGYKASNRLRNQFNFLNENKTNIFPKCSIESSNNNLEHFSYDMPYSMSMSFYDFENKERRFGEILQNIVDFSNRHSQEKPNINVRKYCYDTFIVPGVNIYNDVTGKNRQFPFNNYNEIPEFIEDYRCSCYHGDTTFENILVGNNDEILIIDPVPDGNAIHGLIHDFAKIGQSLYGYEKIRDNKIEDYGILFKIFSEYVDKYLSVSEINSLKFHISCLFFRRLKHQIYKNRDLVEAYGDIAFRLIEEYKNNNTKWT